MMNLNAKIEELLAVLREKGRRQTEKYSPLGVGYYRSRSRSCRNCFCCLPFLCTGLSGDFEEDFDDDFDDYFEDEEE